jgi:hypothetical protein
MLEASNLMMLTFEWITSVTEFKKKRNGKSIDREKNRRRREKLIQFISNLYRNKDE